MNRINDDALEILTETARALGYALLASASAMLVNAHVGDEELRVTVRAAITATERDIGLLRQMLAAMESDETGPAKGGAP